MSLFHVFAPLILIFSVLRLGYEKKGLILQTAITWIALTLSYLLTDPETNINWVWGPFGKPQVVVDGWVYFLACLAAYPLLLYVPTHGMMLFIQTTRKLLKARKTAHLSVSRDLRKVFPENNSLSSR
jgi:hypothetical protein